MTKLFFGKWTFEQNGKFVQIEPASGVLKVAAQPNDGSEKFNAYGTATSFILQANNGKYIIASSGSYIASKAATDSLNFFSLVDGSAGFTGIIDLGIKGIGTQYYWNNVSGVLKQIAKSNTPPVTSHFTKAQITVGLSTILEEGFSSSHPDLTWVNFAGVDFSQGASSPQNFTQAILTHADFSGTKYLASTTFQGCNAQHVNFSKATLAGADFGSSQLQYANFSDANLTQTDFSGSHLDNAILINAHLQESINLNGTYFTNAKMKGADFSNAQNIVNTDFTGADLTNVVFTGSSVTGAMILNDANLTNAFLNNAQYWIINDGEKNYCITQGFGKTWYKTSLGVAPGSDSTTKPAFYIPAALKNALANGEPANGAVMAAFSQLGGITLGNRTKVSSNINQTIYPKMIKLNSKTNLTHATVQQIDFTGYALNNMIMTHADFAGCKMDKTHLEGSDMSFGDFTDVTFTGNISMSGVNLSNATLTGANLTGAQMGALSNRFAVPSDNADYKPFLKALSDGSGSGVAKVFLDNHIIFASTPSVLPSEFSPGRVWTVEGLVKSVNETYTVRLGTIGSTQSLGVFQTSTAAVLTNAFMKGVILTSANLYQVRASGIQLYGGVTLDGSVILEGAQFNNGNLAQINLKQAFLYGVNFDYCVLNNAHFDGAHLTMSAAGGLASFNTSNLQGASFKDAKMANTVFTDAAVSVAQSKAPTKAAGVWLFDAKPQDSENIIAQLTTAASSHNNFVLPTEAANLLKPGAVADTIKKLFKSKGVSLGEAALISLLGETAYWKISDGGKTYAIFQGCNQNTYTPALGVAAGTSPLVPPQFHIPYSLENELKPGKVRPAIINEFKSIHNVTLSASAVVSVGQQATDWQIVDSSASYSLWLGLSKSCVTEISVRPGIPAIQALFTNHSMPLSTRATITAKGNLWEVNNDSDNPFNPIINYIKFNVFKTPEAGLDIYGSEMRIARLAAGNQQEFHNIKSDITQLVEGDLVDSTICPNSLTVASNKTDKLPADQWMRARALPGAPKCVPSADFTYYCPK